MPMPTMIANETKLWNLNWNSQTYMIEAQQKSTPKSHMWVVCSAFEARRFFKGLQKIQISSFYDFGFMQNILMRLIGCHRKLCMLLSVSKHFNHTIGKFWFLSTDFR